MLSASTLSFLDALCRASHDAYPEGGALWTYVEAANQAHSRFDDPMRVPPAGALEIQQLARWIQSATGDRGPVNPASLGMAETLVGHLREDLGSVDVLWSFHDDGTDMRASIFLARTPDNRFFALDLWWSED